MNIFKTKQVLGVVTKFFLFWLLLSILAGGMVLILSLPFGTHQKWVELPIFLEALFMCGWLFYLGDIWLDISFKAIASSIWDGKWNHFRVALKYFGIYLGLGTGAAAILAILIFGAKNYSQIGLSSVWLLQDPARVSDFVRINGFLKSSPADFSLYFLGACILAPLLEEVYFRQQLFTELRKYSGPMISILISSAIFGLFHHQMVYTTIIGVYLAYVFEKERNLSLNIILHSMINMFTICLWIIGWQLRPLLQR